jgi:hypothetical protein
MTGVYTTIAKKRVEQSQAPSVISPPPQIHTNDQATSSPTALTNQFASKRANVQTNQEAIPQVDQFTQKPAKLQADKQISLQGCKPVSR